ncbi:sterile alpha motif domain-containing protein 14 [Protopterus annectens]|uniref:sterile alpha motif domain-containing protein 14 n=1 Tax=Protopterus annectens TaxID=7888 RepID=UPI001CF9DAF4|nr:sterile alpha motif domain-containing protein 14 [Protopterus annectens]
MSSRKTGDTDEVFDFKDVIPETERLDSSLQKARAQLSVRVRRQRPSRSRLRDSISSTEGEDSLERKASENHGSPLQSMRSPLHCSLRASSPSSDSVLSSSSPLLRGTAFSFDTSIVRRTLEEGEQVSSPVARYQPLTNASSQEALGSSPTSSPSKSCQSSDSSPVYVRRERRMGRHSEDECRDSGPGEAGSPTLGLDKKTKRKFLDLGVTLRRTSKGRKGEKASNRLSMGSRESSEGSVRSSPFVPFSWFTDSSKGSTSSGSPASPSCSPKTASEGFSPRKSASQDSTLSDDCSPRSSSPKMQSKSTADTRPSYPYHTLSQSSDEFLDEPTSLVSTWTNQQVIQWLGGLSMDQYIPEFTTNNIDGQQLLQMDGGKLKSLGVTNSQDRALMKKKLKELSAVVEKERKAQEKMEKQREKQKRKEQEQVQKKS